MPHLYTVVVNMDNKKQQLPLLDHLSIADGIMKENASLAKLILDKIPELANKK